LNGWDFHVFWPIWVSLIKNLFIHLIVNGDFP
jgi:hypothetical protein